jgi:glycosyltransferase involved in cell wall biosynthesis
MRTSSDGLRILIDGRKLGDGGIGVYIDNLIRGLLGLRRASVRVQLAAGDYSWPVTDEDRAAERLHIGVITRPLKKSAGSPAVAPDSSGQGYAWRSQVEIIEDSSPHYSWDELVRLPKRLPWDDYDIFHAPHFMLPFGVPLPSVVTLHDLIHIQHPERAFYPYVANFLIRSALKRATRVVSVSQSTYDDLRRLVGDSSKVMRNVRVVSNAVDPFFLSPPLDTSHVAVARAKKPFFLCVLSNAKPHKGLEDLMQAWTVFKAHLSNKRMSEQGASERVGEELRPGKASQNARNTPRLVIAGLGTDKICDNAELLQRVAERDDVILLGAVSKEELRSWYQAADSVVVPSRAEGFGLPVIEAHACGTSVVMRPVPALLELVASSDHVAHDMSINALATAMGSAWNSCCGSMQKSVAPAPTSGEETPSLFGYSENLRASALGAQSASLRAETAARFDIVDVARATLQVYREALSELRR